MLLLFSFTRLFLFIISYLDLLCFATGYMAELFRIRNGTWTLLASQLTQDRPKVWQFKGNVVSMTIFQYHWFGRQTRFNCYSAFHTLRKHFCNYMWSLKCDNALKFKNRLQDTKTSFFYSHPYTNVKHRFIRMYCRIFIARNLQMCSLNHHFPMTDMGTYSTKRFCLYRLWPHWLEV